MKRKKRKTFKSILKFLRIKHGQNKKKLLKKTIHVE